MILFNLTGGFTLRSSKIPSVNEMYDYNRRTGAKYKTAVVAEYQYNIEILMCKTNLKYIRHISKFIGEVDIDFVFILGKGRKFWGLDTSNMIKATEDSVVKIANFDDAGHRVVNSIKIKTDESYDSAEVSYLMILNCNVEELAMELAKAGLTTPLEYRSLKDSIHYHSFMRRYRSCEMENRLRDEFSNYLMIPGL